MKQGPGEVRNTKFGETLKKHGIKGTVKMLCQPIQQGKILIRLENIADLYDKGAKTQQVDFSNLVVSLWQNSNEKDFGRIKVEELSLTGTMPMKDMLKRKIQWKTKDDENKEWSRSKIDRSSYNIIDMEPQRIRVF